MLSDFVATEVEHRLDHVMDLKARSDRGLADARAYVEAMLGLQVWSHELYLATTATAHGDAAGHEHHEH